MSLILKYQLDKRVDSGLIKRQKHKNFPLYIYSYSNECQYTGSWDEYTLIARGLILDKLGNIVAKPFPKFFNYGESCRPDIPKNMPHTVYEKVDGSLGINFFYNETRYWATRGSFDNEYVDFASNFSCDYSKNYTVMAEICMPIDLDGMRRAIPHEPGLYLLGGSDLYSKKDLDPRKLLSDWRYFNPEIFDTDIEQLIENSDDVTGTEGWVVRFDNGLRIKVKTIWYLKMFWVLSHLEDNLKEKLLTGLSKKEILQSLPEELRQDATDLIDKIQGYVQNKRISVEIEFANLEKGNRKDFALSVKDSPNRPYLFKMLDNRDINTMLLKEGIEEFLN